MTHQLLLGEEAEPRPTIAERPVVWSFSVVGKPVAKGRPRADWRHRRIYTPKATEDYERDVATIARIRRPAGWPLDALYQVRIDVYCRNLVELVDADNMKTICDALQGIAFDNDKQVRSYRCDTHVIGGPNATVDDVSEPRVDVTIEVLP